MFPEPTSMSAETSATHKSPARAPGSGKRKCKSVSRATTNPTNASHLGSTPDPSAASEVAVTITEAPTWQKWYSYAESASDVKAGWAPGAKFSNRTTAAG